MFNLGKFPEWKAVTPPEHITYFTRDGISRLLERYGLNVTGFTFSPIKQGIRLVARKSETGAPAEAGKQKASAKGVKDKKLVPAE